MRATEKSLMELAGKAEEASEVAAVSARQLPAKLEARTREVQGDPSACGKGYVDISSDSYRGYPKTELMST